MESSLSLQLPLTLHAYATLRSHCILQAALADAAATIEQQGGALEAAAQSHGEETAALRAAAAAAAEAHASEAAALRAALEAASTAHAAAAKEAAGLRASLDVECAASAQLAAQLETAQVRRAWTSTFCCKPCCMLKSAVSLRKRRRGCGRCGTLSARRRHSWRHRWKAHRCAGF